MSNSNSGRKAAQRTFKATECVKCGGTKTLQRHHKDRNPNNNKPENVEVLCQKWGSINALKRWSQESLVE